MSTATRVGAVIITMGNRPDELRALLDSVAKQDGDRVEVVVVGNGSPVPDVPAGVRTVELPENLGMINVEQLRQLLNQRNVLFETEKVDISSAVIANLDSKYKASGGSTNPAGGGAAGTGGTGAAGGAGAPAGGGTGAAPAPAPAPAPKK